MASQTLRSQWLEGTVRHRRLAPVSHQFRYNTGMLAVDLSEWEAVTDVSRWFSLERFNWMSLKRNDYMPSRGGSLEQAVRDQVEEATGWRPDGPVELITHPRYLGYVFNPVSFYFCYHAGANPAAGDLPAVILAEITNTPWHQRHIYCLECDHPETLPSGWQTLRFGFDKRFHVSPFNPMDQQYRWSFSFRAGELRIHMNVLGKEQKEFDATLVVRRAPLTRKVFNKALRAFPLESLKVVTGIYWHALRLKLKGARFYSNPDKLPDEDPAHGLGAGDQGYPAGTDNNDEHYSAKVSSWRT
jgi:DUF1365 family protein